MLCVGLRWSLSASFVSGRLICTRIQRERDDRKRKKIRDSTRRDFCAREEEKDGRQAPERRFRRAYRYVYFCKKSASMPRTFAERAIFRGLMYPSSRGHPYSLHNLLSLGWITTKYIYVPSGLSYRSAIISVSIVISVQSYEWNYPETA